MTSWIPGSIADEGGDGPAKQWSEWSFSMAGSESQL
jgi:hypothetical protein